MSIQTFWSFYLSYFFLLLTYKNSLYIFWMQMYDLQMLSPYHFDYNFQETELNANKETRILVLFLIYYFFNFHSLISAICKWQIWHFFKHGNKYTAVNHIRNIVSPWKLSSDSRILHKLNSSKNIIKWLSVE